MDYNYFKEKNLVLDKYMVIKGDDISFKSDLQSLIDNDDISTEDAFNIIYELMYGVKNYNYDKEDIDEEFTRLTEKVKEYNIKNQDTIKNGVLFFKDYSYEKELLKAFSPNLKSNDNFKNDINLEMNNIESDKTLNIEKDVNFTSLSIRERMELDKEIRRLSHQIRKQNPYNWREILKETPVYKLRHGLETNNENKSDVNQKDDVDLKSKTNENKNIDDLENASDENLSKKELKKLKIRSDYLSNKIKYTIKNYHDFITKINFELEQTNDESIDKYLKQMLADLKLTHNDLIDYRERCKDFKILDTISAKISDADNDLKVNKQDIEQKLSHFKKSKYERLEDKLNEYFELLDKFKSKIDDKLHNFSILDSRLNDLIDNSMELDDRFGKRQLLFDLEIIKGEFEENYGNLFTIRSKLNDEDFIFFHDFQEADKEFKMLNKLIDESNQVDYDYFERKFIEHEKIYQNLLDLSDEIHVENVKELLDECDKYFNRKMFRRRLKKFNLEDGELDIIKGGIEKDIVNHVITGENRDLKDIIETRCKEFRKNNSEFDETEINDLLNNCTFPEVDEIIVNECKNKVKTDFLKGNITFNQAELKLKNYINKKLKESDQLEELEKIKNNPSIPNIKIHLSPEENDEIYMITKAEITSENGIDNVENRFHYWVNKKIRENQSEARSRLNVLKRDFSSITNLSKKQQIEFIHQIEFNINNNKIKYFEITEDNIVGLSEDYINYGKLKL